MLFGIFSNHADNMIISFWTNVELWLDSVMQSNKQKLDIQIMYIFYTILLCR